MADAAPAPEPEIEEDDASDPTAPPDPSAAPDPLDERLAPHFRLRELVKSKAAERLGLSNMPTPEALANLRVAAAGMERAREILGRNPIKINSGYRSPEVNAAVGGTATSDHMSGYSVDFISPNFGTPYEIVAKLSSDEAFMADVDQIIHEKGIWVHISFAPRRKKEVLTAYLKTETGGRIHYKSGLHKLDGDARLVED